MCKMMQNNEQVFDALLGVIWENILEPDIFDKGDFYDSYCDEDWYDVNKEDELWEEFCDKRDRFVNRDITADDAIDFIKKYL